MTTITLFGGAAARLSHFYLANLGFLTDCPAQSLGSTWASFKPPMARGSSSGPSFDAGGFLRGVFWLGDFGPISAH